MKYLILIFVVILSSNLILAQATIDDANEKIREEKYEEAIVILLQLKENNGTSSELFANLGYAYFQIDDLANSVLYYERGVQLSPKNKDIQKALQQVRNQLPVRITQIPDFILVEWFRSVSNIFKSSTWATMQLLTFVNMIFILFRWFFRKKMERWDIRRWSFVAGSLLLILSFSFLSYNKWLDERGGGDAISKSSQTIYKSPDERSDAVVDIGPGNKVFILDTLDNWYKVQLADKDVGWCRKDQVIII